MSNDLLLGWILGLLGSLLSGIVLFWLQAKRDAQMERLKQIQEDTRVARDWKENGKKRSLRGYNFTGANLSGKDLSGADLEDAVFEKAKMWQTDLGGANLIRANFHKAKLVGVNLNNTNLTLADFRGATIIECNFKRAKLRRTQLRKVAEIKNCIWDNVEIDETTELNEKLRSEINKKLSRN